MSQHIPTSQLASVSLPAVPARFVGNTLWTGDTLNGVAQCSDPADGHQIANAINVAHRAAEVAQRALSHIQRPDPAMFAGRTVDAARWLEARMRLIEDLEALASLATQPPPVEPTAEVAPARADDVDPYHDPHYEVPAA